MPDLKNRILLRIVPRLYVIITSIWFSTCRLKERNFEHMQHAEEHQPVIACFWHFSILYFFHHLRKFSATVMVSSSRDGEYIARIAVLLGLKTVRGSSNRQGVRALKELLHKVREGSNAGIVADGSQGPALRVQPGMILLAGKTGKPILPMTWSASRYITFNSWDHTVLPLPFCTIYMHYGAPFYVPENLKTQQVEEYRQNLESVLRQLYTQAWHEVGKQSHLKASK